MIWVGLAHWGLRRFFRLCVGLGRSASPLIRSSLKPSPSLLHCLTAAVPHAPERWGGSRAWGWGANGLL